jgi:hypothetical protein
MLDAGILMPAASASMPMPLASYANTTVTKIKHRLVSVAKVGSID